MLNTPVVASASASATAPAATAGSAASVLGWPTADATAVPTGGGTVQLFTGGRLYTRSGAVPVPVTGTVLQTYLARGETASVFGWPTAPAATVTAHGITGTQQVFASGVVQVTSAGTRTITGLIWSDYRYHGGVTGGLGWITAPAVHSSAFGGGWYETFQGGTVYYSTATKQVHPLTGTMLALANAAGGPAAIGWPGVQQKLTDAGGGSLVVCSNGRLYASKSGTWFVSGAVLTKYVALKATAGRLGWPSAAATTSATGTAQRFQHGTITVTTAGKVTVAYR